MKGYAKCPASCGEFVQGMIGNEEYLCSYAVNLFSEVYLEERKDGEEEDLTERVKGTDKKIYIRNVKKSRLAIKKVFEKYDIPLETLNNISVKIISEVPVSKGMGSSTADIGAAIGAALNFIGEEMTCDEIAEIAASIEPTDSVFMEENVIFNPVKGKVKEKLGYVDNMKALLLEPNKYLNTVDLRKNRMYREAYILSIKLPTAPPNIKENPIRLSFEFSLAKIYSTNNTAAIVIVTKNSCLYDSFISWRKLKAAPGFNTYTILKNPSITGTASYNSILVFIIYFVTISSSSGISVKISKHFLRSDISLHNVFKLFFISIKIKPLHIFGILLYGCCFYQQYQSGSSILHILVPHWL